MSSSIQRLDYTFKGLGDFDAQSGFYSMVKAEVLPLDGFITMPLYALSVDSVINGPTAIAGRPLRRLYMNQATEYLRGVIKSVKTLTLHLALLYNLMEHAVLCLLTLMLLLDVLYSKMD